MGGLVSPEGAPGSGIIAPPTPLGIQPSSPPARQQPTAPDAGVKQRIDASEAAGRADPFKVLANFSIGNAVPGGASPVTDVDPAFADAMARMAADMPPDIQKRFRIISGYRSADREQEVNPAVGYGRSEHTNRYAADLAKDPVVLQWIAQNGAKYGVGFPLAHDPAEINHLEFMPNGQRMPLAKSLSMQDAGGFTLRDAWNAQLTPDMRQALAGIAGVSAQTAAGIKSKFDEYNRIANSAEPGSRERDEAIAEMRKASREMQQDFRQMMQHPPMQKPVDAWQNFGSVATMVGLLGGLFARQHMTAALNAAGTAMEAINSNNSEQYERAYKQWHDQADMGIKMIDMQNADIRSLLEDKKMSIDEKTTRLSTIATEMGMIKTLGDVSKSPFEQRLDVAEKLRTTAASTKAAIDQVMFGHAVTSYNAAKAAGKSDEEATAAFNTAMGRGGHVSVKTDHNVRVEDPETGKLLWEGLAHQNQDGSYVKAGTTDPLPKGTIKGEGAAPAPMSPEIKVPDTWEGMETGKAVPGVRQDIWDAAVEYVITGKMPAMGMATGPRSMILAAEPAVRHSLGIDNPADVPGVQAKYAGLRHAEIVLSSRTANLGLAMNEAKRFLPLGLAASGKVDRTEFKTLNSVYEKYLAGTGDQNIVRLITATNAITNAYAQVAARGGQSSDQARATAREILENAYSKGQYATAADQLMKEVIVAQQAPIDTQADILKTFAAKQGVTEVPRHYIGQVINTKQGQVYVTGGDMNSDNPDVELVNPR